MSHTDKDAPIYVRYLDGSIPRTEFHDHIGGYCDLDEQLAEQPRKVHGGFEVLPDKFRRKASYHLDFDQESGETTTVRSGETLVPAIRFHCSYGVHYTSRHGHRDHHTKRRHRDSSNLHMAVREYNSFGEVDDDRLELAGHLAIITD